MITAFIRTVILYFVIMIGMRLMGKRQIGELEPGEFVLTMMISDLASVPMQDFGIPLLSGLISIFTLLAFSMLLSCLSLRNIKFRELLCGKPVVLIQDGVLNQTAMARNRYTLDELLEELRGQGYFQLRDIKYAILENSGHLSVMPFKQSQPPSAEDLKLNIPDHQRLPVIFINDGRILSRDLYQSGHDEQWLKRILSERGISSPREIFLLALDTNGEIFYIKKEAAS